MNNRSRVIVALDLETPEAAIAMARNIAPIFPFFKIGIKLFTQSGPELVKQILPFGEVFLDLKFYDIPSIVGAAVFQAAKLGVSLLTVHVSGGMEMMRACFENARRAANPPRLLGVTVLTSFRDLREFGISRSSAEQVRILGDLAFSAGLDGIVCSPAEVDDLRPRFPGPFLLVTPGIRGLKDDQTDQKRTSTAEEALKAGADFLVIGRPITSAKDPKAAAEELAASIDK